VQLGNEKSQPVRPDLYDEAYFLGSCEGYAEFITSEGAYLSRRLRQACEVAQVRPGMQVLDVGCGRGETLRHCAGLGVRVYGVDYAAVAARMAQRLVETGEEMGGVAGVSMADAKEVNQALAEARRVLRPDGRLIIHTAPNAWYDRYAYPLVRCVRTLMGQGGHYPRDPRAIVPANLDVHVNEQSALSLWRVLRRAGFRAWVWLDTPPQNRHEGWGFGVTRYVLFNWPPFNWFFEREVFAVASAVS
jgi:SAM-dependent methyltransferase